MKNIKTNPILWTTHLILYLIFYAILIWTMTLKGFLHTSGMTLLVFPLIIFSPLVALTTYTNGKFVLARLMTSTLILASLFYSAMINLPLVYFDEQNSVSVPLPTWTNWVFGVVGIVLLLIQVYLIFKLPKSTKNNSLFP